MVVNLGRLSLADYSFHKVCKIPKILCIGISFGFTVGDMPGSIGFSQGTLDLIRALYLIKEHWIYPASIGFSQGALDYVGEHWI
jgi:hypothetical protein